MRTSDSCYYRARYYNPQTGRFISEDPAGFAGRGADHYQFARNDPIDFNDPLSNFPKIAAGGPPYHDWGAPS